MAVWGANRPKLVELRLIEAQSVVRAIQGGTTK